jgi:hypothetical protein
MGTVWRDGTYTVISPDRGPGNNVGGPAEAVSADGSVIVGTVYNELAARFNAARWDWNGASYDLTDLGVLPNTPQTYAAKVWATSVSDDGAVIAGVNRFRDNGPASVVTGFVWTAQDGMRDIVDVMADYGISLPENHYVVSLVVSPDGHAFGLMTLDPSVGFDYWSFLFRITPPPPVCVGDIDQDGATTVFDFAIFANLFGTAGHTPFTNGDLDGDGDVDVFDFGIFAGDFGCGVSSP